MVIIINIGIVFGVIIIVIFYARIRNGGRVLNDYKLFVIGTGVFVDIQDRSIECLAGCVVGRFELRKGFGCASERRII